MTQAVLRTPRLLLVPLADEHLEHEVELDSDPEVMRYLLGRASPRAEVEQSHRRRMAMAQDSAGLGFWVGFLDGEFVGWWILATPERADQRTDPATAELGYRLLRRYWRQGLASEGARELVRHGFEDLRLQRIIAETMAVNVGSRATMESVGLRHGSSFFLEFDELIPGSEHGEVQYAVAREEWLAR